MSLQDTILPAMASTYVQGVLERSVSQASPEHTVLVVGLDCQKALPVAHTAPNMDGCVTLASANASPLACVQLDSNASDMTCDVGEMPAEVLRELVQRTKQFSLKAGKLRRMVEEEQINPSSEQCSHVRKALGLD